MKNRFRKLAIIVGVGFILLNVIAIFHTYNFTHTKIGLEKPRTANPEELNIAEKLKTLLLGINNPRPLNEVSPTQAHETIRIDGKEKLEAWYIKTYADTSKGTVLLFHGFLGKKSDFLRQANVFLELGYNTFLIDFTGSGGSTGNSTTIGYFEAEQVKRAVEYIANRGEKNIVLYGHSMGAAAVLKATHDYALKPAKIIVECPFGTMYQTVSNRFDSMGLPSFPMAFLLVFWGGTINHFWAFDNNPADFAKKVYSPTLILYGLKDNRVKKFEIESIYKNLQGPKTLKVYVGVGHNDFLKVNYRQWRQDVTDFLK